MSKSAVRAIVWPISLMSILVVLFQNCSAVDFATSTPSVLDDDMPFNVGVVTITAGLREVPPLKMVFVVDNSYTMKANQLNLSRSFGKMFEPDSAKSLALFATTSFLINTAQRTPAHGSSEVTQIDTRQLTIAEIENQSYLSLLATHRGSFNSGAIPGDNLGFNTRITASPTLVDFFPAPVLGVRDNGDGKTSVSSSMYKAASESADGFAAEFQRRLALLDSARLPTLRDGSQEFSSILDAESGMCAMARVLRNNSDYFSAGEMAAFVVVSDEDEADAAGANCVQRHSTWTGAEPLVKGNCEHRSTVVTYSTFSRANDSCKISFNKGYKYKYTWPTTVTTYTFPKTKVSYYKSQTVYKLASTLIKYYEVTMVPVYRDGILVGENPSFSSLKEATREGDYTTNCDGLAQIVSTKPALDAAHKPVCSRTEPTVASCSTANPNCLISAIYPSDSLTVNGAYVTGPACTDLVRSVGGAIVDGSKPLTCAAATAGTGSGACPTNLIALGCTTNQAPSEASVTGSILFADSGDGGTTLPLGTSCGAAKSAIYNKVKVANSAAPSNGTCALTAYETGSTSPGLEPIGCTSQASNYCSQNLATARSCSGAVVAGTVTEKKNNLPAVSEQVACAALCNSTKVNLCAATADVIVTPTMTIEQYFKARYGADTKCSTTVTVAKQPFLDRMESEKDKICLTAPYYYYVQDGPSYHKTGPQVEHVAGSVTDSSGKFVPAMTLPEYILQRSNEVFGEVAPFVSMFVRRSSDPPGTAGSTGVKYENLATLMSGRTNSILAEDFSPALQDLSGVLKDRLQRSFNISVMKPHQRVRNAWIWDPTLKDWKKLDRTLWAASGRTVTLSALVEFDLNDSFRFEYW